MWPSKMTDVKMTHISDDVTANYCVLYFLRIFHNRMLLLAGKHQCTRIKLENKLLHICSTTDQYRATLMTVNCVVLLITERVFDSLPNGLQFSHLF